MSGFSKRGDEFLNCTTFLEFVFGRYCLAPGQEKGGNWCTKLVIVIWGGPFLKVHEVTLAILQSTIKQKNGPVMNGCNSVQPEQQLQPTTSGRPWCFNVGSICLIPVYELLTPHNKRFHPRERERGLLGHGSPSGSTWPTDYANQPSEAVTFAQVTILVCYKMRNNPRSV